MLIIGMGFTLPREPELILMTDLGNRFVCSLKNEYLLTPWVSGEFYKEQVIALREFINEYLASKKNVENINNL